MVASPPPVENFDVLPVITEAPYTFNPVSEEKAK
jgi:hypothetical protein